MDAHDLSPYQRLQIHVQTLYCLNAQDRLTAVNEIDEPPAALFYFGRSVAGNVWHFRDDLPAAMVAKLDTLCRAEPVVTDFTRAPQQAATMRAIVMEYVAPSSLREYRGPAYWLPDQAAPSTNAAQVAIPITTTTAITTANVDLCAATFPWLLPLIDAPRLGPVMATVVDHQAVAICFCSRRPGQATEAGAETLAAHRGRGYATATVAAWAAAVRAQGCMPMYSTAWNNHASQAVARKLGAVMYGEDWSLSRGPKNAL